LCVVAIRGAESRNAQPVLRGDQPSVEAGTSWTRPRCVVINSAYGTSQYRNKSVPYIDNLKRMTDGVLTAQVPLRNAKGTPTTGVVLRGRRRDVSRDDALRQATIELLVEHGYDRLTIDAVAARARAGKATV
jgi:hypothetical protein